MTVQVVGIDIAKHIFHVHGINGDGNVAVHKQLRRLEVLRYFANMPRCLIGMEACGSSNYWARCFQKLGHEVRLMAPQFVKPYVKSNKNDWLDAEAICEAVTRPTMRFVPVKSAEQQAVMALHRAREILIRSKVAMSNQILGLLLEFGIVVPGMRQLTSTLAELSSDCENELPPVFRHLLEAMRRHFCEINDRANELERQILAWHRQDDRSRRLSTIPGVGPITASALAVSVTDPMSFKNGRQLAAWIGLVPKQHSTGGRARLLGISKRGDAYLRRLLVHGARAVLRRRAQCPDGPESWAAKLARRRHHNIAIVAIANKNARAAWALLHNGTVFTPAA